MGSSTALLSLVGVLGAQSKGAWLALSATAGFLIILALFQQAGRARLPLLGILALMMVISGTFALPLIDKVAGPTMTATGELAQGMLSQSPVAALEATIEDPMTPQAMRERLMLWMNALELVEASPVTGWGNLWLREWQTTRYRDVGYTLLHNGYLEILVRHGLLGIIFLLAFAIVAARRVNSARLSGAISTSLAAYLYTVTFFFFCTIATNSNNRLALGESYYILAGSAIFALTLLSRHPRLPGGLGRNDLEDMLDGRGNQDQTVDVPRPIP
jgi:O-antigen ligase